MMLMLISVALFGSFSLAVYFCIYGTVRLVEQHSSTYTASTEFNMRKLYVFTDTRKWLAMYAAALLLLPVFLHFIGAGIMVVALSILVLVIAPKWVYAWLAMKRRSRINESLPDALAQIAGAMRAGASFTHSIQSYVEENTGPLGQEFSVLLREQRLGARLEDALDSLAERVQSEEMDLVVSAAMIASDVGGNLAEILQGLSLSLRKKLEMEGKIKALTAQGKLQGWVVSALPVMILLALAKFEPEATLPIFNTLLGWVFLGVIIVMLIVGSVVISKIVSIDI